MHIYVLASYAFFSTRRLLTYLHFFQQEEYDGVRFLRWVVRTFSVDRRATFSVLAVSCVQLAGFISNRVALILVAIAFFGLAAMEKDPRLQAKKRLSMTARAKRVFITALFIAVTIGAALVRAGGNILLWLVLVQAIPVILVLANIILMPYERRIQKQFWDEAHRKLLSIKPISVAITGSYGKTSVKHILGHILGISAPTLITPASVNTPMGVSRIVREQMRPQHRFFVCEMGAYGPGSIRRMCDLVPPDMGVITAIGWAHYERFKTLDTVAKAKFELAEVVVRTGGKVVLTEEIAQLEYAAHFVSQHGRNVLLVGSGDTCSLRIVSSSLTIKGMRLEITWKGKPYILRACLYGRHHGLNMAIAFAAACELGVAPEDAILGLASAPQINHRLEVKRLASGAVLIDDAYNSNPVGFANALSLLDLFRHDEGRRILVTPGMVELGRAHEEEHRKIGALAGVHADVLLSVVPQRIRPLTDAYRSANPTGEIVPCPNFRTAEVWLERNCRPTDAVLLENDLPDLYETKPKL